jgi:hypothetical protein
VLHSAAPQRLGIAERCRVSLYRWHIACTRRRSEPPAAAPRPSGEPPIEQSEAYVDLDTSGLYRFPRAALLQGTTPLSRRQSVGARRCA